MIYTFGSSVFVEHEFAKLRTFSERPFDDGYIRCHGSVLSYTDIVRDDIGTRYVSALLFIE